MFAAVYVPGVTLVFAREIVPVVVTGPPVKPVPVATEVTVPEPLAVELIVWLGHVPVTVTFVPATNDGAVVPVPPLLTGSVPVTPVDKGKPVRLVAVPLDGVPKGPPLVKYDPAGCLLLNVVQSALVKYPSVVALAEAIEMAGVTPPLDTIGDVPVTAVTEPEPLLLKVVQSDEVK
jgi:hypothetical protein